VLFDVWLGGSVIFLTGSFAERNQARQGAESNTNKDGLAVNQQIDETITGLLGRIMDGTCRPLKVRHCDPLMNTI
jgi:hypothetical protein